MGSDRLNIVTWWCASLSLFKSRVDQPTSKYLYEIGYSFGKKVFQFWSQVEGRRIRIDLLEAGLVKIFSSSDKKLKHILLHCQMISSQFCYIAKWSLYNFATLSSKCFLHLQINVFKFATMPNKFFTFLLLCQMSSFLSKTQRHLVPTWLIRIIYKKIWAIKTLVKSLFCVNIWFIKQNNSSFIYWYFTI